MLPASSVVQSDMSHIKIIKSAEGSIVGLKRVEWELGHVKIMLAHIYGPFSFLTKIMSRELEKLHVNIC